MKQLRIGTLITAFSGLSAFGVSSAAFAQAPCGEDACEPGFECEVSEGPCGGSCYKTDDGETICEEECSPELYYYCTPKSCDADADCGGVMVCNTFEASECSVSVSSDCADDGSDCEDVREESTCTTFEYQQCAYRHELPCESDEQCGEGFTCVETETCWCSGGTSSGGDDSDDSSTSDESDEAGDESEDGDATDEPPPPDQDADCGCEPSGEKACQVKSIECAADADCPSGWSCAPGSQSCWGDESGVIGCETSPASCQPPGSGGNGSSGGEDEPTSPDEGGSDDGGSDDGDDDEWSEEDESGPKGEGSDTTDDSEDANGRPHADLSGLWALLGCSVQHAPGNAGAGALAWLAAAFGLVAVRRRNNR